MRINMKWTATGLLTVKCAGLQGIYWMSFCSVYSFASVFLLSKHLENQQIGLVLAVSNIASVILQPALGAWADKTTRVSLQTIIRSLAFLNIVLLGVLAAFPSIMAASVLLYGGAVALTLTLQPLLNSFIFSYQNEGRDINFGLTRGIGSICFAFLSLLLGLALNRYHPSVLPFVCISLFAGLLLLMQAFPKLEACSKQKVEVSRSAPQRAFADSLHVFKKYDRFALLLLALSFLFIFHTIANTYLAQIMSHLGGEKNDFGLSLTIAAVCELPAMLGFKHLTSRFTSAALLKTAGCFYVVRSVLFLLSSSVWMINAAQLFQGLSFAVYVPASVYYVNRLMGSEDKVKGQTFIVGSTTLGSVFGSILGGWLLDHAGVHAMLTAGAASAMAGCLLLLYSVKSEALPSQG